MGMNTIRVSHEKGAFARLRIASSIYIRKTLEPAKFAGSSPVVVLVGFGRPHWSFAEFTENADMDMGVFVEEVIRAVIQLIKSRGAPVGRVSSQYLLIKA